MTVGNSRDAPIASRFLVAHRQTSGLCVGEPRSVEQRKKCREMTKDTWKR